MPLPRKLPLPRAGWVSLPRNPRRHLRARPWHRKRLRRQPKLHQQRKLRLNLFCRLRQGNPQVDMKGRLPIIVLSAALPVLVNGCASLRPATPEEIAYDKPIPNKSSDEPLTPFWEWVNFVAQLPIYWYHP